MNKTELTAKVAKEAGISQKDTAAVINATLDAIVEAVKNEETVQLIGFGTFEARKRAAREGKNPQTGEKIKIAAATVPAFKAGKAFKDAVNAK